jgi:hypothetical protein
MKSIVRILAMLYPASWRARYGAEFEALLDDVSPSSRQALDVFLGAMSMQITTWNFGKVVAISDLNLLFALELVRFFLAYETPNLIHFHVKYTGISLIFSSIVI